MGNFLHELGLGFLTKDDETFGNFLRLSVNEGKAIPNYFGFPYINMYYGSSQIVCRLGKTLEGDKLKFVGLDTHMTGRCVWKLRVEKR